MCSIFAISADHEYILTVKKSQNTVVCREVSSPTYVATNSECIFSKHLKKVIMVREHLFKVVELNKGYEKRSNFAQAILKLSRCLLWKN